MRVYGLYVLLESERGVNNSRCAAGKGFFRAMASGAASAISQPIMIRPQTELDYCLTTITRKLEKAGLLSVFNGFRKVQRILTNLVGIRTMIENTAFYPDAPENSDSVGRTFESCRAYHINETV